MIGDYFGYGVSALTAIGAVVFGVKQASSSDRTGIAARLQQVETRCDALTNRVQILERREVWHERKEGILIDALNENQIDVPEMPPAPETYES